MSLSFSISTFQSLFPNADTSNSSKVEYEVEDSQYRVYNPAWEDNALAIQIDHIRAGATDDHVELSLTFNPADASLTGITGTWKAGNDGYKIPKVVIEAVDATAEILGAVGAIESAGISEEVANAAVAAFDGFCKLFNTLSPIIVGLSDDGGRFYTLAVVCHTVNRACSSMRVK